MGLVVLPLAEAPARCIMTAISAAIRAETRALQGKRQPCYICGEHEAISQCHHLISVREIEAAIRRSNNWNQPMPLVWLCPNHHAYWHLLERASKQQRLRLFREWGDESAAFLELLELKVKTLAEFHNVELPDGL